MNLSVIVLLIPVLLALPRAQPLGAPRDLAEAFPAATLAYFGWPGLDALSEAHGDTALRRLAAEPEVARFRERLCAALDG